MMKSRLPKGLLKLDTVAGLLIISAVFLLTFRLGSLTHGHLAAAEQPLPGLRDGLSALWHNPLYAPWKVVQLLTALVLPTSGVGSARLPSAMLGAVFLVTMYWLLRQWYGRRLANFSMPLLISAPWFLHVARLATPDILYPLATVSVMALTALWHKQERKAWLLPLTAIIGALLLYIPGGLLLILVLVCFKGRVMLLESRKHAAHSAISTALWLIMILPLLHWLISVEHLGQWLGMGDAWISTTQYARSFIAAWIHIFAGHWLNPLYNVGGLPAVNIAMTFAFLTGLYLYGEHIKAPRTRFLGALWLVGTALLALPGGPQLSLLLPIVMVLVTGGLGYLLHRWLHVFPRNPLARGFGMALILAIVLFAIAYNVTSYFDAWPHNLEVEQTFSHLL